MTDVMKGIRILEVAEYTFVPAASAVLAEWGADVIKIEHAERGDAIRGLGSTGVMDLSKGVHVINEHSNRGKRSLGLDLTKPEGLEVLYKLAETCDVFLTNKQPNILKKLKIDVDDIRAHNPKIIYARGTSFGPKGPDADKGGYDMTAFWCRAGGADAVTPPGMGFVLPQPAPAYGDTIGGMTIAGGISAALLKRERTGEPSVVDVSLLGTGTWAMSGAISTSLQSGKPWALGSGSGGGGPSNPLTGLFETSDKRFICFIMLQGFKYWPDVCKHVGLDELIEDERFNTHENLSTNSKAASKLLSKAIKTKTLAEWTSALQTMTGQWAAVQNTLEVAADEQVRANGYVATTKTKDGTEFDMPASPVQFDEQPTAVLRAPEFNEHGDEILEELGLDMERIIELKIAGAVT